MLTEQQKQSIKLRCIDGLSVQETAAALGVHRCTVWRWSQKKGYYSEWKRQVRQHVRQQRIESGYYRRRAAHRAKLRRLETKLDKVSAEVKGNDTRALDKAYDDYLKCLFEGFKLY